MKKKYHAIWNIMLYIWGKGGKRFFTLHAETLEMCACVGHRAQSTSYTHTHTHYSRYSRDEGQSFSFSYFLHFSLTSHSPSLPRGGHLDCLGNCLHGSCPDCAGLFLPPCTERWVAIAIRALSITLKHLVYTLQFCVYPCVCVCVWTIQDVVNRVSITWTCWRQLSLLHRWTWTISSSWRWARLTLAAFPSICSDGFWE